MQLPSLNTPAELHRKVGMAISDPELDGDIVVARGPFIILACGFMALDVKDRGALWISCPSGVLTAGEVEDAVRHWRGH